MLWRHGDVLIASIDAIPAGAQRHTGSVLAYGEATGHAHCIADPTTAELWEQHGQLFLRVVAAAQLIHEEHQAISLPVGTYRVWQQREYTPAEIKHIKD